MRKDNRTPTQLRELKITPHVLDYAEGSAEINLGNTRLICSASVDVVMPKWIKTPGMGWINAEYSMIPRSTHHRIQRNKATQSGRSQEISRLIGRSLRAGIDLKKLGERQIHIDCDVIQADGGTRTAGVTGGFVALALAMQNLKEDSMIEHLPLTRYISAVSAGILNKNLLLDLCCQEDQHAEVDMNFVVSPGKKIIEIQGTAEKKPFTQNQLHEMLEIIWPAAQLIFHEQEKITGSFFPLPAEESRQ